MRYGMSCFDMAVQIVLQDEGGFVNDPQDSGGATKYGISLKWLSSLSLAPEIVHLDQNGNGVIDVEDMHALTREQAIFLYRRYFWEPHHYDRIAVQLIATKVFDFAVNAGSHTAHQHLQWALHATGQKEIVIDGVLGDQTIQAVNATDFRVLLAAYRSEIAGYYRLLKQPHFEAGWLKRAYF
jgi:lysozyme family protein